MKKIKLLFFITLINLGFLSAQNKQLLYDFIEIPQSLMLNPGVKTNFDWHVGIPLLSGIGLQAGISGVTVNDLFANDGIDFTDKVRDRAINSLDENDIIGGSGQIELFNIGFRKRNNPDVYYSFGIYGEGFLAQYWPKDLAILAFEGNAANIGRRFDLNDLTSQGEAVNIFHFGINKKVNNKLQLGFRGKLYSSVFQFESVGNDGYFETTEGENNTLRNNLVADVSLRTSGLDEFENVLADPTLNARVEYPKIFLGRSFLGGDLGLGFDVGFSHQLNKRTVLTGSLLDVGFIYYSTDVRNFTLQGSTTNEGLEVILPDALDDFNIDIWEALIDDIETQIPFVTDDNAYIRLRPVKLNASIRYNFGATNFSNNICDCPVIRDKKNRISHSEYNNGIGAHLFAIHRPRGPLVALTGFYQKRLGNFLSLKGTYTVDKFSFTNIGLGLNFQSGPINFYILGDNILGYQNIADSNSASFQFGFNIISWNSY